MSDLTMVLFHWEGDSAELQQHYDDVLEHVVDVSPARPLVHLAAPVETGFQVIDVWTSEQVARNMVENPQFREKLQDYGLAHADIEYVTIHNMGWPVSASPMYR